jgi:hypothetical protein
MLSLREKALIINGLRSYMKALAQVSPDYFGDIDRKLAFAADVLEVPVQVLEAVRVEQQRFLEQIAGAAGWDWSNGN